MELNPGFELISGRNSYRSWDLSSF